MRFRILNRNISNQNAAHDNTFLPWFEQKNTLKWPAQILGIYGPQNAFIIILKGEVATQLQGVFMPRFGQINLVLWLWALNNS